MRRTLRGCVATAALAAAAALPPLSAAQRGDCGTCKARLELFVDRVTFQAGEPILITTRLTNLGDREIPIVHSSESTSHSDRYLFEVYTDAGGRVPIPSSGYPFVGPVGLSTIVPGKSDERQLTLNYQVLPLTVGRYRVKAIFETSGQPRLRPESDVLVITIVAMPRDHAKERISRLGRQAESVPCDAAPLLGFTGDNTAIPPLIDMLYSTAEPCAAFAAVEALGYFDRRIVTKSLLDGLAHRGPRERMIEYLVTDLRPAPSRVRPLLVRALRSPDASARAAAVEGLYLLGVDRGAVDRSLFPAFARLLHDPSPDVRRYASIEVGVYGGQLALDALRSAVTDPDDDLSEQATIAVGWIATDAAAESETRRQAVELLTTLADSGRPRVSSEAAECLSKVRPR